MEIMLRILDGRVVQDKIKAALIKRRLSPAPHLVIIQVGERPESSLYIERKKKFGTQLGVKVTHARYPSTISETKLITAINHFNNCPTVHGIIVQIPLSKHLATTLILNAVRAVKDVDGLSATNLQSAWQNRTDGFRPATARAVLTLLDYYKIPLRGQEVVIIGRSALVGKLIALACLNAGATVTVCHRETKHLPTVTKRADILIVAAGAPGLITKKYVRAGQVVVDVGINVLPRGKLLKGIGPRKIVGDVAFGEVARVVRAISPVPGGVGPLTIACLFQNLIEAYRRQKGK